MSANRANDIAIVGMACVYPGAENFHRYWENIVQKVNAIGDPPPDWEADLFWDPNSKTIDRTYCKRGGWLGKLASFDPFSLGIMPAAIDGAEPDHFMALQTAHDALQDAQVKNLEEVKHRTAVIIGRGTYINRGNAAALQQSVIVESVIRIIRQLHPEHTDEELALIKKELQKTAPPFHADTAPGLVPNIITGRICNRLDLMGPNYLIDAACASSLVAVEMACRELRNGQCDLALAGGVHANTSPVLMMIFSNLGALSRKGEMRPFDEGADGTLLGEGVGMVVLKRLADAEQAGDKIYAVLKGIGIASDGKAIGVLAPRVEGEETALRRAYENAGVDPSTIGLLEAHGTSTTVGDVVEMDSLRKVFGDRSTESPRSAIGSVKSMISHTVPASGMAGLIKAVMALHHKVLPPTLGVEKVNPKLKLEGSNIYINTETRPWIHGTDKYPRRAGVNAFGFGGINAHAIVEEYNGPNQAPWFIHEWDSELFVFSGATRDEVVGEAKRIQAFLQDKGSSVNLKNLAWTLNVSKPMGGVRLAIVGKNHEDLLAKLERALKRLGDERTKSIRDIEGIYYFRDPLAKSGKLAFVFPGEGSQYRNMLADLCIHFPEVRQVFDLMDRAYETTSRNYLPSDVIFPCPLGSPSWDRLFNMDSGAETVFCSNQAMYALMQKLGIQADAMVGHSTGEHSALLASDTVQAHTDEELIEHILGVYSVFDSLNKTAGIPEAVLLAIAGADHKLMEKKVTESNGELYTALDNCIHQLVICGKEKVVDALMKELSTSPAICQKLPFARAYHTPWFEVFSKPLKSHFDRLRISKPNVALYSCVTTERYPEDPEEIRRLASVQWSSSVRFRETTEKMHTEGVRLFVEVGPKSNLTGFIDDTLRGKQYMAIPSNVSHRSGILQLNHMLGQLVAHGVNPKLGVLYERRDPRPVDEVSKPKRRMEMKTGVQPLRLPKDFQLPKKKEAPPLVVEKPIEPVVAKPATLPPPPVPVPVTMPAMAAAGVVAPSAPVDPRQAIMQEHLRTMEQFMRTQQDVMTAYLAARQGNGKTVTAPPPPAQPIAPVATRPVAPLPAPRPVAAVPAPSPRKRPFYQDIVEVVPGVRAVARHTFSRERESIFEHHTLGLDISQDDPDLRGLPMVPLTVTMEILAEGGALLFPGKVLTGMRDVRATRWITLEKPGFTLEATATQKAPGEVHVALREAGPADSLRPIYAEAICLFADKYPDPGPPRPFVLENERVSSWKPEMLYATGMFHDALMRGTKSVERAGRNGTSATLEALPHNQLFTDNPTPDFLFDPVLLDAAGQVVAYWFWEAIQRGTDLFPYRIAAFDCYAPAPPTGTKVECRVVRKFENEMMIHSDIEVLDRSGKVYYRLTTWETRRFPQPPRFLALRVNARDSLVSASWTTPLAGVEPGTLVACCRLDDLTPDFLEGSHGIWLKALAYLALSRRERAEFDSMNGPLKRRMDWVLGRCAAKDAVRVLIKEKYGVQLCAADVEITSDAKGRPMAGGAWKERLKADPLISITHTNGIAAAIATLGSGQLAGIDIEFLGQRPEGFETVAFSDEERKWLGEIPHEQREEWSLRLWCAKEAVAKALGHGLTHGVQSVRMKSADVESGTVLAELTGGFAAEFPQYTGRPIAAHTTRDGQAVSAVVLQQGTK
jgi:acyl transferase domain-containing protein/phosphopantetheinyl transferase